MRPWFPAAACTGYYVGMMLIYLMPAEFWMATIFAAGALLVGTVAVKHRRLDRKMQAARVAHQLTYYTHGKIWTKNE